jgi:hypothetical protein
VNPAPDYCPFYCEENVWHLCAHPSVSGCDRRVLFISNTARRVAMWGQRAAVASGGPIAWDYHVVLLFRRVAAGGAESRWWVWDLDAERPEPVLAARWLSASFDATGLLPPIYAPAFRMVTCADYRRHLRSDRRHMRQPDGSPRQPPPAWPMILGEPPACAPADDDGNNLDRFIDTSDPSFLGELFELGELRRWLG